MTFESVCIAGLGYIGLPTAVVFAERGVRVFGYDTNAALVDDINRGRAPLVEPDLAEHLGAVVAAGALTAALSPTRADATVIAVPTPFLADKSADLSYIQAAAETIAPVLYDGALVVLESTSPPGATEQLAAWLAAARPDLVSGDGELLIDIVHCPERVLPGNILSELVTNDRVVGGLTTRASERGRALYSLICNGEILLTDAKTAELSKCVENSFRDVNIAFANELSLVCDTLGIDVWQLIDLANHHPRVNILQPGPGVGGHCLAVDPWFIVAADPVNSRLIRTAREVNDGKPAWVADKVNEALSDKPESTIAALGLAFKPDIDDLRESPARAVVETIAKANPAAHVLVVEPNVSSLPSELAALRNVSLVDYQTALAQADCVVLLVDHKEFRTRPTLRDDVIIVDTRGRWR